MEIIALIGRILLLPLFVGSGLNHLTQTQGMSGYAQSKGVPQGAASALVVISGLVMIVGAVLVALGVWGDLGALLLVIHLVPAAFVMHAFWKESDPQAKMAEQAQFMKNIALAGAALVLLAVFATGDMGLTLTDSLWQMIG